MTSELARIAAMTMPQVLKHHAETHGDDLALRDKNRGLWQRATWKDYFDKARLFAIALYAGGFRAGDRLAVIEFAPHPDVLGTLAGEEEGSRHERGAEPDAYSDRSSYTRSGHERRYGKGRMLLLAGRRDDLPAVIFAAIRTNMMRSPHLAAVGTRYEVKEAYGVVCATLVATGLGDFSLGNCTHDLTSLSH